MHFRSVAELRLVLGMDDDLQQALAPLLMVHSRAAEVDRACQKKAGDFTPTALMMGPEGDRP